MIAAPMQWVARPGKGVVVRFRWCAQYKMGRTSTGR